MFHFEKIKQLAKVDKKYNLPGNILCSLIFKSRRKLSKRSIEKPGDLSIQHEKLNKIIK